MELFWILLGVAMASILWYMYIKVHSVKKMPLKAWILTIVSVLWFGFTLAWAASSIAEGEIQAAGMGLLVFGIILIAMVAFTRVMIIGKKVSSDSRADINA